MGMHDIKSILDDADPELLKNFLLPVLGEDVSLRKKFLDGFAGTGKAHLRDFYKEVDQEFAKTRREAGYGSSTDLDGYLDSVKEYERDGSMAEAVRMYHDIARGIVKNSDMLDHSEAFEIEDFSTAIRGMVGCINRQGMSHETKREYISYLFKLVQDNYGYWDACEDALTGICTDRADLEYWNELLGPVMPAKLDKGAMEYYKDCENVLTRIAVLQRLDRESARNVYEQYKYDSNIRAKYKKLPE